jgi:hypothetical protein
MKRVSKESLELTEALLKNLQQLVAIRDEMQEKDDETESNDDDQEIIDSMKKDYESCFEWALNLKENEKVDISGSKKIWEALHPTLPVPRVCLVPPEKIGYGYSMLFLMDAYPLYLKSK